MLLVLFALLRWMTSKLQVSTLHHIPLAGSDKPPQQLERPVLNFGYNPSLALTLGLVDGLDKEARPTHSSGSALVWKVKDVS